MGNVNLYTKFDYTDNDGNRYTGGSTIAAKTINVDQGSVYDNTFHVVSGNLQTLWNDDEGLSDFDFLWIISDQAGDVQLVCNEGGIIGTGADGDLENGFVITLTAGIPFYLSNNDSRNRGDMIDSVDATNYALEMDNWETTWIADTIDRIEWFHATGTPAKVRIFAVT